MRSCSAVRCWPRSGVRCCAEHSAAGRCVNSWGPCQAQRHAQFSAPGGVLLLVDGDLHLPVCSSAPRRRRQCQIWGWGSIHISCTTCAAFLRAGSPGRLAPRDDALAPLAVPYPSLHCEIRRKSKPTPFFLSLGLDEDTRYMTCVSPPPTCRTASTASSFRRSSWPHRQVPVWSTWRHCLRERDCLRCDHV
jgi:hypothetical protein